MTEPRADTMSADELARALDRITYKSGLSGTTSTFEYDALTGRSAMRRTQRVDHIIDDNTRRRNEFTRARSSGLDDTGIIYMCDVPVVVLDEIKAKFGVTFETDQKRFFRILDTHYPALNATNMKLESLAK